MPNHVINEMIFRDVSEDQVSAIMAAACGASAEVNFEVLVPVPLNLWMGSVGKEHQRAFRQTALDWQRENWGTKWNAYSHKPIDRTADTLTLRFETAWAPPYPWLAAILNKLQLPFEHNWLDEGAERAVSGVFSIDDRWGAEWKEAQASDEVHRHLHKLHWGVEQFDDEGQES